MSEQVDVIIPTQCDVPRSTLLLRAIDSVVSQEGVRGVPVVVVNGPRYDPALLARLRSRSDIRLLQIDTQGVFFARRAGYEAVTSEFFATLDDDDVFLPGALARRLEAARADSATDWVVTNGIHVHPDGETPFIPDVEAVRRDSFGTLLDHCWLCSAGNLFRTSALRPEVFDAVRSMDVTYIAFWMLSQNRKLALIDEPTFRYFYYPDSLSKKEQYVLPSADAISAMMRLAVPAWVRRGLARKYRMAMHDLADYHRRHGMLRQAWAAHLRSIAGLPELFRYAWFTRRLIPALGNDSLDVSPHAR